MDRKDMGSVLYDKLPSIYKAEDSKIYPNPYPLKRFLQVLGSGMDFMTSKIDGHINMYNVSQCPAELLPLMAETFGFSFPPNFTEAEKRRFVGALPDLYKIKGTPQSFKDLARAVFGQDVTVNVWKKDYSADPTNPEPRVIYISVEATNIFDDVAKKEEFFNRYVELLRPVNKALNVEVAVFFKEVYDIKEMADDEYLSQSLTDTQPTEVYDLSANATEAFEIHIVVIADTDSYSLNTSQDDAINDLLTLFETDAEAYNRLYRTDDYNLDIPKYSEGDETVAISQKLVPDKMGIMTNLGLLSSTRFNLYSPEDEVSKVYENGVVRVLAY